MAYITHQVLHKPMQYYTRLCARNVTATEAEVRCSCVNKAAMLGSVFILVSIMYGDQLQANHCVRDGFCVVNSCTKFLLIMLMMMLIFIHEKDTLQIMAANKQQSPDLRMPVEGYKKLIWLIIN